MIDTTGFGCRRSAPRLQHADVAVNKILIGNKCDMDEDREVSLGKRASFGPRGQTLAG